MIPILKKYRLLTLVIFAIGVGVIWRAEVEYHGWKGLIWISYFHYAIPAAIVFFLIWLNLSITMELGKRIAFLTVLAICSVIFMWLLQQSLTRLFMSGPSAFINTMQDPSLDFLNQVHFTSIPLIPLAPLIMAIIAKGFGVKCKLKFIIFSTVLMITSPEIVVFILDLTDHKGPPDYIHTIKSGYLMSMWFFTLGLTYIGSEKFVRITAPTQHADLIDNNNHLG